MEAAELKLQRPDLSYSAAYGIFPDGAGGIKSQIESGGKLRLYDSAGRIISQVDEATGKITRTNYSTTATGVQKKTMHDSASPAVDDVIFEEVYAGKNDAGEEVEYARVRALIKNVGNGTEEAWLRFSVMNAGTLDDDAFEVRIVGGEPVLYVGGSAVSAVDDSALTALMPKVRGTRTTTFAVSQSSETAVELSVTSVEDVAGMHDSVTNSHRLVSKLAGWYRYEAHARLNSTGSSSAVWYFVVRDNAGTLLNFESGSLASATNYRGGNMAGMVYLEVDEWIALYAYQNITTSVNILSDEPPFVSMQRIGP